MSDKTVNVPTWHAAFDARISNAKGELGTVPTKAAYQASLLLAKAGSTKRAGVEALMVAMTLRPQGTTVAQFMNAGECRTANNWLAHISGNLKRGVLGLVTVTKVGGVVTSRLTAKGAAQLKAAGMNANDIAALSKAPSEPRKPAAPRKPKAPKPAVTVTVSEPQAPAQA